MLVSPPRIASVAYRDLLGCQVFDCMPLRATLTPAACAANFQKNLDGSVCQRCIIGADHAGTVPDALAGQRAMTCIRCHQGTPRLIGRALCLSCFNRAREVEVGRNRKGGPPSRWAGRLRLAYAVVAVPDSTTTAQALLARRPQSRWPPRAISPSWSLLDRSHAWLEWIAASEQEIRDLIRRHLPGGELIDLELAPISPRSPRA
jgi:hypothetical protein